jgi:hypothetical protein
VKTETDVGVLGEGDSVSMDPYRSYIPSSFSLQKYEPEVSQCFRWFLSSVCVCVCVCVCMCVCLRARVRACVRVLMKRNYHTLFPCEYSLCYFL